jgi:hypothetical protein
MRKISALAIVLVIIGAGVVTAQGRMSNPNSNKAFFAKSTDEVILAPIGGATSSTVTLIDIPQAFKTSNNGAASAILSMEASLWTYNITTAIVNGGKNSSSSRATIEAWVEIDGNVLEPGVVVFADRLQATGLTVNLACQTSDPLITCTVTGDVTLELFQATKSANSFTFFGGPLGATTHSVAVYARGAIRCTNNSGATITCPTGTLAGYQNASTMAAIGKATLLVEEQQNWGSN